MPDSAFARLGTLRNNSAKMAEEVKSLKYNSENKLRQTVLAIRQHEFQQALTLPPWLTNMESPFKWARILKRELTYYLMYSKLADYKNQGSYYGFEKFAILLVIIHKKVLLLRYAEMNSDDESETDESEGKSSSENRKEEEDGAENSNDDEGEENIRCYDYELEEAVVKCEETLSEMAADADVMYCRIGPVLHHVLDTTKAHILFVQGKIPESKESAKNIQDVEQMSVQCKAGIQGLRVKFIMSMYQDYRVVLPYLSKAIELDPQFGYWHYLTGKVLRRLRREYKEKMIVDELEHFERAVELERNPKFLVFLAQAYQEMNRVSPSDNMLQKSADLYRECWRLKNDSAPISRRVGNGMMKMRASFFDKVITKEALLKAEELSPTALGPHLVLGKFYYYHEKNDEKALEYFEKSAPSNFASGEIIRLNLIKDPNYDPLDVLKEWVNCDQGTLKYQSACCDCGWYYLMYKKDLEKSVKYFWEVLKMDYQSFKVVEFDSYSFLVKGPINMVKVLANEVLLLKEKNESLPSEERKDLKVLEDFLEKVFEKHPGLQNMTPDTNLLDELKMNVERAIVWKRRQRYGGSYRKSESSCKSEKPGSWRNYQSQGIEDSDSQTQYKQQGNWKFNKAHSSSIRGNNQTNMRSSFSEDNDRSDRRYSRDDDRRRNSESQYRWSRVTSDDREGTTNQSESNQRYNVNNRGRINRQQTSNNNSRYDVTVTDWRSENRK